MSQKSDVRKPFAFSDLLQSLALRAISGNHELKFRPIAQDCRSLQNRFNAAGEAERTHVGGDYLVCFTDKGRRRYDVVDVKAVREQDDLADSHAALDDRRASGIAHGRDQESSSVQHIAE